jgi:hypothetical protein
VGNESGGGTTAEDPELFFPVPVVSGDG